MRKYLDLLKTIKENGTRKSDRTGTGTISINGHMMRFNLSDGFPIVTTKFTAFRLVVSELLWMLNGDTNILSLQDQNNHIWDAWADEEGNLGPVYGKMFTAYPPPPAAFPVKRKHVIDTTSKPLFDKLSISTDNAKYTGSVITNICGDTFTVIGKDDSNKTYTIQFVETGWIKRGVNTRSIRNGSVCDQMVPSVYGIGCLGDYKNKKASTQDKILKKHWENMLSRCYNTHDKTYHNHGGKGVVVCERWKVLSTFIEDVKKIPNWHVKKFNKSYVLDKDYYGESFIYSPDNCVWVNREENNMYRVDAISIVAKSKTTTLYFPTVNKACEYFNISSTKFKSILTTNKKIHGFSISEFHSDDYVVRYGLYTNQIQYVIDELKRNPYSRRLYINLWHPSFVPDSGSSPSENASLGKQALTPCHLSVQFLVRDNKLDCIMYMRSNDCILGNPFNIAAYSLLTHMIAKECGLDVGDYVHMIGDAHIYINHLDKLDELLEREPLPLPKLWLNPDIDSIFDYTIDDIKLIDYQYHPKMSFPVAV